MGIRDTKGVPYLSIQYSEKEQTVCPSVHDTPIRVQLCRETAGNMAKKAANRNLSKVILDAAGGCDACALNFVDRILQLHYS